MIGDIDTDEMITFTVFDFMRGKICVTTWIQRNEHLKFRIIRITALYQHPWHVSKYETRSNNNK